MGEPLSIILFVGDSPLHRTIKGQTCYLGDFDARFGVRALTVANRLAEGDTNDVWPELSRVALQTNNLEIIDVILQSEACSAEVYRVRDGQWRELPADLARRLRFERGIDIR